MKPDQFKFRYGPWAVVTGASSGIGRAIALELARRGLNLVLVSRNLDSLNELAAILESESINVRVIALDLSLRESSTRLDQETRDLDVGLLVASAGFGSSGPFLNGDLEQECEMLDLNSGAVLSLSSLFGRRLAERGKGGLILVSSIVAFQGTPWSAHYSATKAYVQTLAEALHMELKPQGVDVLACAPGPIQSGFANRARMTLGQAATPESVAGPTLDALGHRMTVVPGLLPKLLVSSLAFLPRSMRVRIMGKAMRGLAKRK